MHVLFSPIKPDSRQELLDNDQFADPSYRCIHPYVLLPKLQEELDIRDFKCFQYIWLMSSTAVIHASLFKKRNDKQ